jgi:hypothetical protein
MGVDQTAFINLHASSSLNRVGMDLKSDPSTVNQKLQFVSLKV